MTSSDDEEVQVVSEKSKRKSYAVEEKLKAVEISRKKSVREAAEEFGVTERMVYNWLKQAVQLKERGWLRSYVNYRLRTSNRKPKYYNDMHFLGACSQDHILSLKYRF